jgi:ribonucleoside-diphosphate reductase beta chain
MIVADEGLVTSLEPKIFDEQIARKPDRYPMAQKFMDAMWQSFWTPNEFNFNSDVQDFKTNLTEQEKEMIKRTLSAIGQIEIAVKTFWAKLGDNLPHPSLRDLGYCLANVEVIHNIAYEKLLRVLGLEDAFEENLKLDIIKGRVDYLRKYNKKQYVDSKKQYIYSLILFTLFVENVSLFSQFYTISWFGRFLNALKDTNQQVAYTRTEETAHAQVGIWLVNQIRSEYPELFDEELEAKIYSEAKEAFRCESKIIDWMIGDYDHPNLNAAVLKEYIKNRLNDSLSQIGFDRTFEVDESVLENTYWMDEEVMGNTATDFFYKKPTDYAKNNASFDSSDLF